MGKMFRNYLVSAALSVGFVVGAAHAGTVGPFGLAQESVDGDAQRGNAIFGFPNAIVPNGVTTGSPSPSRAVQVWPVPNPVLVPVLKPPQSPVELVDAPVWDDGLVGPKFDFDYECGSMQDCQDLAYTYEDLAEVPLPAGWGFLLASLLAVTVVGRRRAN